MDRKPVVDRYMMAGPFSWESTRKMINDNFIAVRAIPGKDEQKKYALEPYKFVEPGFLILDSSGNEKLKVDKITTLHEGWFNHLVSSSVKNGNKLDLRHDDQTQSVLESMRKAEALFHAGSHQAATKAWQEIATAHSEHPLGWKAAAEAEGFGPIVRGFEVNSNIPTEAMNAGIKSEGSASPPGVYSENDLVTRSVNFLLSMQREDGGFVDSDYDFGGTDSLPNVHVAVTSLAGMALLSRRLELDENDQAMIQKLDRAISLAAKYVSNPENINTMDRDEILWAYAYRLRFLSRLVALDAKWKDTLQSCTATLEVIKTQRGGWYHEYNNPFVTATALSALSEAKKSGAKVNQSKITEGVASLAKDRYGNGAFPYGSSRPGAVSKKGSPRNVAASAGRMPLCELGLWHWGESDDETLASAIKVSFDMHEHLLSAVKYDDHTSNMGYGGFFFWYDMRGRSEAISHVKDEPLRKELAARQREIILAMPELDGCFVDSHELGRCYGTSMALLSLQLLK